MDTRDQVSNEPGRARAKDSETQGAEQNAAGAEPAASEASGDWREVEEQLNALPDEKLLKALEGAGIKAVLPSHKKGHSPGKVPGQRGEATERWTAGDWMERVDMGGLSDAQKFLGDPDRPPTRAQDRDTPSSLATAGLAQPPGRATNGLVWGSVLGVLLMLGGVWLWQGQTGSRPLAAPTGPEPRALPPEPVLVNAAPVERASGAPAEQGPPASAAKTPVAKKPAPQPQEAPTVGHDGQELRFSDARVRRLARRARRGDAVAMSQLAQAYVERHDAEQALKWAKKAYRADRRNMDTRVALGDAYLLAGDDMMAEKTWRRALSRSPRNEALRARLGMD